MTKKWGEKLEKFGISKQFVHIKTRAYGYYEFNMSDIIKQGKLEQLFDTIKRVCEEQAGIIR
jgi:hypothetical protein